VLLLACSTALAVDNQFSDDVVIFDNQPLALGTDKDFQLSFVSADGKLYLKDVAGNTMLTLTNAGTSGRLTLGGIDNTPIGATTASTGRFTTVTTTAGATVGTTLIVNGVTEFKDTPTVTSSSGRMYIKNTTSGGAQSFIGFQQMNSADTLTFSTAIRNRLYDATPGAEYGHVAFSLMDSGTIKDNYFVFRPDGLQIKSGKTAYIGTDTDPDLLQMAADKLTINGDLDILADDLTSNAATFNLLNTTSTTVNFGGNAAVNIGATGKVTKVAQLFSVGADDNVNASVKLYGNNASTGAQLYIYNPADKDTTTEYYMLTADTSFKIYGDGNEIFSLDENGIGTIGRAGGTITVVGGTVYTPSGTLDIAAATGITTLMLAYSITRIQGSGGACDISANPQIADGADGQIIRLQGDSDTNTVTFEDGTGLALAGAAAFVAGKGDILCLTYDAGDDVWYEISRSNN
jgi:hypothetical protein